MSDFQKALNQAQNRLGNLTTQANSAVKDALIAARETGKKTSVGLTLTFDPMQQGAVAVSGNVKLTLPNPAEKSHAGLIFSDQEGNVHLNPQQADTFSDGLPDEVLRFLDRR